ncbi:MAG: 50S ribosomal protein L9 [Candidatus Izimaplasma sp.]|nr:50S ribosomal protein L9 [Candidatus Izimaplasma bacterium]
MKALLKVLVPISITLLFLIFYLFKDNPVFIIVSSGIIMVIMVNLYFQVYYYHGKDQKISRLSKKLKETQDIVDRKDIAEKKVIAEMPLGIIVFDESLIVKWANNCAKDIFENVLVKRNIETLSTEIFNNLIDKQPSKILVMKIYMHEYEVEFDFENLILYLTQVSEREEIKRKYDNATDVIAVLNLDNLDDAISVLDVSERSYIQGRYLQVLENWGEDFGFYLAPITNSKLIAIMNKSNLLDLIDDEFKILNEISNISKENDLLVTLSSGIGCANVKFNKLGVIAEAALDLALSRGGDQIVVNIEGNDLRYFGGNTNTAEKRTRITTRINTQKLEKLFDECNRVFIMPHFLPDTDALGAAMGILKLAQTFNKETYIILDSDNIDKTVKKIIQLIKYEYVIFLDYIVTPSYAMDYINKEDLLILVDHHSYGQTIEPKVINKTKKLVIIDHHRKLADAIPNALISHIEPYASSSVELVTEMIDLSSKDVEINQFEATVMLSGIMVDTNNFIYRTGSRTFEASAILRKFGADTFKVKTILREGLEEIQLKSQLLSIAEVIHSKFSIVIVPRNIPTTRNLLAKVADMLLEIDNTVASFAIGFFEDGMVGISARSLEGFNVQVIMEKFKGGGHLNNAGAQIETNNIEKVKADLVELINEAIVEEKPMKIILIKDVKGKGKKGNVIDVAAGYGNYLLSSKNAIEATTENLQSIETEKARKEEIERKLFEKMKTLKEKIEKLPVKVHVKIGENGKLFGKINSKQIAHEYKKQNGLEIDKRKIQLKDNMAALGNYSVDVKLHKNVTAKIEVLVVEE